MTVDVGIPLSLMHYAGGRGLPQPLKGLRNDTIADHCDIGRKK